MICENLGQGVYSTSCCTLIGRDTFLLKLDCVAFFVTTSWELDNMATELKCNSFLKTLVQVLCFGWNTDFLYFDDYIDLRHSKECAKTWIKISQYCCRPSQNIWTSYEFKQLKWNKKNFDFAVRHTQKFTNLQIWISTSNFEYFGTLSKYNFIFTFDLERDIPFLLIKFI